MKQFKDSYIYLIIIILSATVITSCDKSEDEIPGFIEWVNPVSNNPIQTIDWLKEKKNEVLTYVESEKDVYLSYDIPHVISYIQSYRYNGAAYYFVFFNMLENPERITFPSIIYTADGKVFMENVPDPKHGYEENKDAEAFFKNATIGNIWWRYRLSLDINP